MAIDPNIKLLLEQLNEGDTPPISSMTPVEARPMLRGIAALDGPSQEVGAVADRTVPGPAGAIPVRIYRPQSDDGSALPVLVWYHGGGFVLGDLETADPTARKLANRSGAVVVSVDYRLAPEDPFPAGVDDSWAVLEWVATHGDELAANSSRLAVGGDSAGGNLAAVMAQRAAGRGAPALRAQLLVYPVTDLRMTHPSIIENGEGYLLTRESMRWFHDLYLGPDGDPSNPVASPLLAEDVSDVAPAIVVTAGFDPLRDEGDAYAERLDASGVKVTHLRYDDMIHGFASMAAVTPRTDEMLTEVGEALRGLLA